MSSTYSTSLRIELIGTGDQSGTWGQTTNRNLGTLLEQAIGGYQSIILADSNYTLTTENGASDEARNMVLRFTGALTAARTVFCPDNMEKIYIVENATSGNQDILFRPTSGNGVYIPNGARAIIWADGVNVKSAFHNSHLYNAILDGGTLDSPAIIDPLVAGGAIDSTLITGSGFTGGLVANLASPITVADGGTGASTAANARTNLGLGTMATQNANNVAITGGSVALTTPLPVASGGTGSATAADARTALGIGGMATQSPSSVAITGGSITGITDLAVADGGTGASTPAGARTNLELGSIATQNADNVSITGGSIEGITDLRVLDGGTGVSTLTGIVKGNGTNAFSAAVAGTDYVAPSAVGVSIQAYSADLSAIAALTTTGYLKRNAAGSWSTDAGPSSGGTGTVTSVNASGGTTGFTFTGGPITSSGTLTMAVSSASSARTALGLGTAATFSDTAFAKVASTNTFSSAQNFSSGIAVDGLSTFDVTTSGTMVRLGTATTTISTSRLIVGSVGANGPTATGGIETTCASTGARYHLITSTSGAHSGSLVTSNNSLSIVNPSDYRLKTNIAPMTGSMAKISQLQPKTYNWIAYPDAPKMEGFIAHELQSVVPIAVIGQKDAVDEDGNIIEQNVDLLKLIPLLTSALKDAIAKIDTLEQRIAALENA